MIDCERNIVMQRSKICSAKDFTRALNYKLSFNLCMHFLG